MEKKGNFQGKKKNKNKHKAKVVIKTNFLIFLPFLFLVFYLIYLGCFYNRIYPFVSVAYFNLAGQTRPQAEKILKEIVKKKPLSSLTLLYKNQQWFLPLENLNFHYLPAETAEKAFLVGRKQNLAANFKEQQLAFWQKINLPLSYKLDEIKLTTQIATLSAQIDLAAVPPVIQVLDKPEPKTGEKITIIEGKPGRKLQQEKTRELIKNQLGQLEDEPLSLAVEITLPEVSEKTVLETKSRAARLLDKKIVLAFNDELWELKDKEIINFLSFYQLWDEEKIATYTAGLTPSINRPAQDALFRFQNGRVVEFKPALAGQTLDEAKTRQFLLEALQRLENETQNQIARINLPVNLTQPKVGTAEVNSLGIRELLGEGNSWFYGSISGRIYNIQLAAGKINGLLVAPGETFSFNKAVGDISAATGFKQAYIIQGNRTVLGDGGGVCQVSTTLFRAVLNAGLPIEERHAHAYRVGYYEYNSDPGLDATVYYPSEDFKFKNDTLGHILIQSYANTAKMQLIFQLYGAADGRKVTISKAKVWDQVAPPPDLYQDDPSLPAGTVKQVDFRAWGAKVSFDWKVTRGNETLQEKTFYSSYRPWQAIFLKGTKQ